MKEKKNIPEIRFEGFEGEWVKKRLEDFCSYHSSNLSYNSVIANGQYELYDANGVIGYSNDYFLDSDYITIIKDGSGVGRVRLLPKNTSFIGTMGAFKVKDSDIRFLLCCLLITDFSKHVIGATIPHIYFSNYGKEEYFVPSIEEQSQIGTFFQNLDNQITLEQQKHNKLVTLKKAMLEKMFPKEGASVPDIRFKGFEGEWEEKKLEDVTYITTGKLDANAMKNDGKYDFYTSGIQKYKIDVYAFEGPAITIAGNGATVGFMHFANGFFNAYQRTYVLSNFTDNREFLYYEISKVLPLKIKEEVRSANIPYIVLDMLTDLKIKTPSLKEQSQIGTYFQNLDNLISLQQQKIDKLKNIKKACLEKMFV